MAVKHFNQFGEASLKSITQNNNTTMSSSKSRPIDFDKLARKSAKQKQQQQQSTIKAFASGGPVRGGTVQDKQPAPIQITAEQILREAFDHQEPEKQQKQDITDLEDLEEFRLRKRKEFEDRLRVGRMNMGNYIRYATFEETQKQYTRARAIYERALDVDPRSVNVWLKYAEMEMKNKMINHARNVFNRAVTILPRVNQLWFKFAYMEELLGQVSEARNIFERWMQWHPDEQAWKAYVKMEVRYQEYDRARLILKRYVHIHPVVKSWIYFARFEQKLGNVDNARKVYEAALKVLDEKADEELFLAFAKFEEDNREIERARGIYKYALDHIPKHRAEDLFRKFVTFEKQFGDKDGIEDVIIGQRRFQYEDELKKNAHNYDTWFDYIRLEEEHGQKDKIRDVYERAIANIPPIMEKKYWKRYIYLWINYALFEELTANDVDRTRDVYTGLLKLIPHKEFSFSKIWIMFAKFEIRNKNVSAARIIFGNAIGLCPKDKIFNEYIKVEIRLGNIDRARKIFERQLEYNSSNCTAWKSYAELEHKLGEIDRARSIYSLAIEQPALDMPEVVWKSFIDFEISLKSYDNARRLYELLLQKTKHVKVWLSYILFETSIEEVDRTRDLYQRAYKYLRTGSIEEDETSMDSEDEQIDRKEQCVTLLKSWKGFEQKYGNTETIQQVESKMPKEVKRKRKVETQDGSVAGWEEYTDYIFADDSKKPSNLKIFDIAKKWRQQQQMQNT
jgi:crooked neck